MQKLYKTFIKKFLNCFVLAALSISTAALDLTFSSTDQSLVAEIANTEALRRKGLMHRKVLDNNHGMLFLWPESKKQCMWMKNTSLPLSVAYISNKGEILGIHDMTPFSEESICASKPVRIALEVNIGWFKKNNIKTGDQINL